ncbi:thiol-disulfide oxidoreductase [Lysinibacillus contaminans]|uniref:Thiol-disulfide oxidoreductase n=1 Tax=Lysinibacillus contaminans TaxID=1293441 RepID=A0ABR5JZE5_9BACI|nr:thiol-disulfide oxidoreductase DCC family protein [Lysinibacillus contaminans]KOS67869.1 thiol-disulfide oxidoreductase [Lysinibacillus contaminans]
MSGILLFDGVCNFCDSSVQFIMKRDKAAYFQFASIQSEAGQALFAKYKIPTEVDSVILIEDGRVYTESTAALKICRHLDGAWQLFYALLVVPPFIRNLFYRLFAKNRYRLFGQKEACMLPTAEQRNRFL